MAWSIIASLLAGLAGPVGPADLERFPPPAEVQAALNFNRAYLSHLQAQQVMEPRRWWDYQEVIRATHRLYAPWDCLDDAQRAATATERRPHLERLRALLGADAFARGHLPPPAPLEYFTVLD